MKYGSVCSGIEAATVAWQPLGWGAAWFAEIEPFPSAVLAHHYPTVPNLGDFTKIGAEHGPIDLLVGGTPCQSFSVAGRRAGLDDPRGNLTLEFFALAARLRPTWLVWENVPGVLSDDAGRTFGTILGVVGELGYGWAYRVMDAQYAGIPQRRRRVFFVGYLGDWRPPAAVLFERQSLSGHPAPSRETGKELAKDVGACLKGGSGERGFPIEFESGLTVAAPIRSRADSQGKGGYAGRGGEDDYNIVAACLNSGGNDGGFRTEPGEHLVAFSANDYRKKQHAPAIAFTERTRLQVRRLTPKECERLQGFPDDFTRIPWKGKPPEQCPDGPRYRAIGNSMAVPCMRWIGERIQMVEAICDAAP